MERAPLKSGEVEWTKGVRKSKIGQQEGRWGWGGKRELAS